MNTQKKYIGSKALIIILSFIIMLNGLGLIVAGVRVKNKKWKWFGIGYIVAEFILPLTGIGVYIAIILYFVCIIHTCLICSEYGRLLGFKESKAYVEDSEQGATLDSIDHQTLQDDDKDEKVNIENLILSIGSATIEGKDRDNLTIQIIDEEGKVYRFRSKGNNIVSFQVGSGRVNSYL